MKITVALLFLYVDKGYRFVDNVVHNMYKIYWQHKPPTIPYGIIPMHVTPRLIPQIAQKL